MRIVNLTPHKISIQSDNGKMFDVAPSGLICRLSEKRVIIDTVRVLDMNINVYATEYGDIENLPEPEPNTIYVVSALVAQVANRSDVFAPGKAIRDTEGRVIGADGLSKI